MTPDHPNLEAELRGLRPSLADEEFLLRLEACANGTLTELNPEELRFEAMLRGSKPAALDPGFLADLEKIVHEVAFPIDGKILLFPKASQVSTHPTSEKRVRRPMWAAAAAVALMGAATALMIPAGTKPAAEFAGTRTITRSPSIPQPAAAANVVPASFNRGVSEVNDEGIVWKGDNQPHNLVRVVYKDLITVKDGNGRSYQIEQPRVQYVLVPARTD